MQAPRNVHLLKWYNYKNNLYYLLHDDDYDRLISQLFSLKKERMFLV